MGSKSQYARPPAPNQGQMMGGQVGQQINGQMMNRPWQMPQAPQQQFTPSYGIVRPPGMAPNQPAAQPSPQPAALQPSGQFQAYNMMAVAPGMTPSQGTSQYSPGMTPQSPTQMKPQQPQQMPQPQPQQGLGPMMSQLLRFGA